jgi:hypothetical protein
LVFAVAGFSAASTATAADCDEASAAPDVKAALAQIEASVDPCGESAEILDLVREFRVCAGRGYRVCRDAESERNFLEPGATKAGVPTTINWNPELRTELELGCGGRPRRPVRRDPVASLLHEVVHAVQDCRGLDPTKYELEAVRVENIYRRGRGLCQRTRYGDTPLPATMTVACEPGDCHCRPGQGELRTATNDIDEAAFSKAVSDAAGDVAVSPDPSASRR